MATFSAVVERLEYLLLAKEAPLRCEGDLRDKVVQLMLELGPIERFLSELDVMSSMNAYLNMRIIELANQLEDAIESHGLFDAASKQKSGFLRCFSNRPTPGPFSRFVDDFSIEINRMKQLLDEEADRADHQIDAAGGGTTESSISTGAPLPQRYRETFFSEIKNRLQEEQSELSVIAICGMGGIGKTTLARSLYNDPLLANHYDNRFWVTVGQVFQTRNILEKMLFSLASTDWSKDEIVRMETMELMGQLYKAQEGKRYLVVLDDVWETKAWDTLRFAFPDDNNGSRILITSRSTSVARHASATGIYLIDVLSEEESWELFKMKSGVDDLATELREEMENIGRKIARECQGLPLAITVISSGLRGKNVKDWGAVLRRLQGDHNSELEHFGLPLNMMILSYNLLPFHLKPCFLYLGLFPDDQEILVEKLCSLWISEGLISARALNDKTRSEVAEEYFNELVDRSLLIEVEENVSASRRYKSCKVHDLIRDLCCFIAHREHFFEVVGFGQGFERGWLTHKLAVYLDHVEDANDDLFHISEAEHIRSLLFFDRDETLQKQTWPTTFFDIDKFRLIRVLDFDGVDFRGKRIPKGIEKLNHLRHLSFRECYLLKLPSSLCNSVFLETLDLRVTVSCVMTIPSNVLRRLSSLRHLYLPLAFRTTLNEKLKLDSLKRLEILVNFNIGICDIGDLQLENLHMFTAIVDGDNMDLTKTMSIMSRNKFLRHFSLVVKQFDSYSNERHSIIKSLLECNGVHALEIEGFLGKFPHPEGITGTNFTELVFNGSEFNKDPMPILAKLPNLRSLVLCDNAFLGKKTVCSNYGFPQLASLKLATLQYLEEWVVETGAMQKLIVLTIEKCDKLVLLPTDGLMEIPTLQKLIIGSMPKEFQHRVRMDEKITRRLQIL